MAFSASEVYAGALNNTFYFALIAANLGTFNQLVRAWLSMPPHKDHRYGTIALRALLWLISFTAAGIACLTITVLLEHQIRNLVDACLTLAGNSVTAVLLYVSFTLLVGLAILVALLTSVVIFAARAAAIPSPSYLKAFGEEFFFSASLFLLIAFVMVTFLGFHS